ncbi:proteasome accessory factor PafA2 family protein [Candidatus Woesearchaeota archaeon]|nr:proteasome accessory factor PafA2 family protein [Candidatus Woesearchaeota archaeon]
MAATISAQTSPTIMGIETEYGITADPSFFEKHGEFYGQRELCTLLLSAHPSAKAKWSYELERPLYDLRGFIAKPENPDCSRYDREERPPIYDKMLPNGARFYIDMDHPEYSTPECTNARDLVVRDKAGEMIVNTAAERVNQELGIGVRIYKHNSDFKGRSFGCHEGYLMRRNVPLEKIITAMIPFLVTRQIYCGAGKFGSELTGENDVYQLSQRADFISSEIGVQTTANRPIFNTRDEPHADEEKFRRIHVILGDANMSEWSSYLKVGTTNLVIKMIEAGFLDNAPQLESPVAAMRKIARDPGCKETVPANKGNLRAVDIQMMYLEAAMRFASQVPPSPEDQHVISTWQETLAALAEDPLQLCRKIDWVIKHRLLSTLQRRHKWKHDSWSIRGADMQYHRVDPDKGLYHYLCREGKIDRLVADDAITQAVTSPPEDTRAYFRGRMIERFGKDIVGINWESLRFSSQVGGGAILFNPMSLTKKDTERILSTANSVQEVIAALATAASS